MVQNSAPSHKSWYQRQNPNSRFIKTRKDFFNDIAEYLEVDYDSMKKKSSNGLCLKDYKLRASKLGTTFETLIGFSTKMSIVPN